MGALDLLQWILSFRVFAALLEFFHLLVVTAKTFRRDSVLITRAASFFIRLKTFQWQDTSAGELLEKVAKEDPHKVCFYFEDRYLTFQQVNELSNRIANYFSSKGLKKGDSVALVMTNVPEYPCVWLGLSKIGVATALVNFNLRLNSLAHCIKISHAKAVIYEKSLAPAIKEALDLDEVGKLGLYSFDGETPEVAGSVNLDEKLKDSPKRCPDGYKSMGFNDDLCYVFTSGTTGMPKAAVIKHHRYIMAAAGAHYVYKVRTDDVFYTPLPLYHMAGGMLAVGQALSFGTTVVIARKFSASRFWSDCIRYDVTVSQYLGELCRFLMSQPPKPEDTSHKVRLLLGNGLRQDMWNEFVERFKIPYIIEFYGSTEGNCSIANIWNQPGAVGHLPRIFLPFYPMSIVKVDQATGEPIRDPKTGLAIRCKPNEVGEMVAGIRSNPLRDFPGYLDKTCTNSKILRDVFSKGDSAFRSGDVLMMDDLGYYYFRDRVGDTYRWKGENVSTMEVELTVSRLCGLNDVAVYGVTVPGMDGRAGMAAISDPGNVLDIEKLSVGILKLLPAYAAPLFLRVLSREVELTGTYKLRKTDMQNEGIDLSKINDKVYVLLKGKYVVLTQELHKQISLGKMRL